MDFNLTPEQQNTILEAASKKLGISREKLENAAKKGDLGVFGNVKWDGDARTISFNR